MIRNYHLIPSQCKRSRSMLGCTVLLLLLFSSREKDLLHSMTCPWFRNFNYIFATKMSSVCVCVCGGGVAYMPVCVYTTR